MGILRLYQRVYSIFDDFTVPHHFWPQSEDCLFLNIWTQHLESKAKKPVLFWIHGGGFYNGSSDGDASL